MSAKNVISLDAVRNIKSAETEDESYRVKIALMDKLELLNEMVRFQEERSKLGQLTLAMIVRGRHLFKALEDNAETHELKNLSRAYRRHLEYELADLRQAKS